jgi:hypothetical protein
MDEYENAAYFLNIIESFTEFDDLRDYFRSSDVGKELELDIFSGRINQRRKWRLIAEADTLEYCLIFFLVSLGDYNRVLWETGTSKRLLDGLEEFQRFSNQPSFRNAKIVLLFTKVTKFEEKFDRVEFRDIFPNFTGRSADEAKYFLKDSFLARCPPDRECETLFVDLFAKDDIH